MSDDTLYRMLDDMERADPLHRPTPFWAAVIDRIVADIETFGLAAFRTHETALSHYAPYYGLINYARNPAPYKDLLDKLKAVGLGLEEMIERELVGEHMFVTDYKVFRAGDPGGAPDLSTVEESDFGGHPFAHVLDGKRYSQAMLNYLKALAYLKKSVDTDTIETVMEIGGGYGVLGEAFLKSPSKPYFYLNVDIPPLAWVSTRYLQAVFGAEAVADYDETAGMDTIDLAALRAAGKRAAVICPWQLPRVAGPVQLFVNTASFQEMELPVVANYVAEIDRLVRPYVLLRNSRHGKQTIAQVGTGGVETPILRQNYLDLFKDWELVGLDSYIFGLQTGRGFESEVMIYRRDPA